MRLLLVLVLCVQCAVARAELTCEQLANVAYAAEQLRNQGQSLAEVMAETEKVDTASKLTRDDFILMRVVVERSFKGIQSPTEILQLCRQETKSKPNR